jgi:hypothetical protein
VEITCGRLPTVKAWQTGHWRSLELAATVGLVIAVVIIAALYGLGIAGMSTVDRTNSGIVLARRFIHTMVPIALAYVVAHYWSLLVYQGQATGYLASNPLVLYRRTRDAVRSQYWMLAIMVAFTSLGLWLLSAAS